MLKLYVWEHGCYGVIFAYAKDKEHARKMILKECSFVPKDDLEREPEEIKDAKAFIIWGE